MSPELIKFISRLKNGPVSCWRFSIPYYVAHSLPSMSANLRNIDINITYII